MQSKLNFLMCGLSAVFMCAFMMGAHAAVNDTDIVENVQFSEIDDENIDAGALAVADYQIEGSLFEQITSLEQEKILMQLEKERAQLDLELDRLAAEKIKLHMEIDTLSGRAEQAQQELETEKARLEAEAASIARQKEELQKPVQSVAPVKSFAQTESKPATISEKYRLVNVIGAGNQLQATLEDLKTGQNKRVSVGKILNGFTVKSISLDEGVVFVKDGVVENLNVASGGAR